MLGGLSTRDPRGPTLRIVQRTVGVWQMAPTPSDLRRNLERLADVAGAARRDHDVDLLVTPELALTGYVVDLRPEHTDPGLRDELGRIARETEVALVVGAAVTEDGATWNASLLVDADGTCRATYRKAHLFGGLDRGRFAPGDEPFAIADLAGLRVATLVCYDVEFPEAVRAAALAGADLLAVPTANMEPWGVVNDHVIAVRAYENQLYVAYANHHGVEDRTEYVGRSVLAAPDGGTRTAAADGEELVVGTVDTDVLARSRARATHLTDRRPGLYRALTDGSQA